MDRLPCLLISLWMSLTVAHAGSNSGAPMDQILSAQASHSAADIVKIARELADDIVTGREAPWRVTAAVVGLYRKAEALEAESITAEDAGRLGRLYLLLSESYADEAKRYLERSVRESGRLEERTALGNALLYLGDAAGARRQYLAVSERRPHDPVIQVNLAMAERALGDTASAYSRLKRVMTQTSDRAIERVARLSRDALAPPGYRRDVSSWHET